MDKQTVYVVTSGQYSDYRIEAVFDNEEDANALAELIGGGYAGVEEYVLNEKADLAKRGLRQYVVYFKGLSADIGTINDWGIEYQEDTVEVIPDAIAHGRREDMLVAYVCARDKEHAAKIAMEKRTIFLANGGGDAID